MMNAKNEIIKPVVIVTGGSRGIGSEIVKLLAKNNYIVVFSYLNEGEKAAALINKLTKENCDVIAVQCDLRKATSIQNMFTKAKKEFGQINFLVNNASFIGQRTSIENFDREDAITVMDINIIGTLNCIADFVKQLPQEAADASIVNISSTAGINGGKNLHAYASSKAALICMTKALSNELAPRGIRVNSIAPGKISSGMSTSFRKAPDDVADVPIGRLGKAIEVAHSVKWLLSNESSYVSGIVLPVSGGR